MMHKIFEFKSENIRYSISNLAIKLYLLLMLLYILVDGRGIKYAFAIVTLIIFLLPKLYLWYVSRKNNLVRRIIIDDDCFQIFLESIKGHESTIYRTDLTILFFKNYIIFQDKISNEKVAIAYKKALEKTESWEDFIGSIK